MNRDLFEAVGIKANVENKKEKEINITGQSMNDFVWAVRLTEVSKSLFRSNISQKTTTKGTVFASGPKKLDMTELLASAGLAVETVHDLEVLQGEDPEHLIAIDE